MRANNLLKLITQDSKWDLLGFEPMDCIDPYYTHSTTAPSSEWQLLIDVYN